MLEFRLRNRVGQEEMDAKIGRRLLLEDVSLLIQGATRVLSPEGKLLCVYLPGAITKELKDQAQPILQELKGSYTSNRGMASGSKAFGTSKEITENGNNPRTYAMAVDSAIVGAFEPGVGTNRQYCRLTAWTGRETEKWKGLWPLFSEIAKQFEEHVPERFANQAREAAKTSPEWVIPGTPFTTITVNNTYATGVHTDKGDLDEGFSTLAVFREGEFTGGWLCFPEYRLGIDMQDRDLLLMDAHAWHGNTSFEPEPERAPNGRLLSDPGFERISIVSYFRTKMVGCGSAVDEAERARVYAENRNQALIGE